MIGPSPNIIERKRLFDLLVRDHVRRTLILGQPGQGKSTLLASCLAANQAETLWLTITPAATGNDDPTPCPRLDCRKSSPTVAQGLATCKMLSSCWQQNLVAMASGPALWIIIDGLHLLNGHPANSNWQAWITSTIENLPGNSRLFLAGRFVPDPLRQTVEKTVRPDLVIHNHHLAFDLEEIRLYFLQAAKLSLTAWEAEHILAITKGWPGALEAALELLAPVPAPERRRYIEAGLESDLVQSLDRFFQQQVLASLSPRTTDLMLEAAIYESLDKQLLEAAGWSKAKIGALDKLHAANLFLYRQYIPDKGWSYEFHPLFRQFLHRCYHQARGRQAFCRASLAAARTCRRIHRTLEAVDNFLAAGRSQEAAEILSRKGVALVATDQYGRLRRLMQSLPVPLMEHNPWLQWLQAVCQPMASVQKVHTFQRLRGWFADLQDWRGQLLATASLLEAATFASFDRRQLAAWVSQGRCLLDNLAGRPYYGWAKACLWLQIGLAQVYTGIDLQQGLSACRNASLLASLIKNDHLLSIAESITALGMTLNGNLDKARLALERAGFLDSRTAGGAYSLLQDVIRLEFCLHQGDWSTATKVKTVLEERIEDSGLVCIYPALLDASARLSLYRGDTADADKWRRHLADAAILAADPYYTAMAHRIGALVRYHQGRFEQAAEFIRRALEILEAEKLATLPYWQVRLAAGMISLRCNRRQEAASHLEAAGHFFDQSACTPGRIEQRLATALLYKLWGRKQSAASQLHAACRLLQASPCNHFTCLRPADLATLGRWAVASGQKTTMACGRLWIQHYGPLAAEIEAGPNLAAAIARKMQIENQQHPLQLRILTFGRFAICHGPTRPVEDRRLVTGRPAQLLKALIVLGVREVPREQLLETLWPEVDPKLSGQTFKVTLHRLRKALEPSLTRGQPSSYLHLSGRRLSLDRNLCWIDSEAFLKLDKEIRRAKEHLDQDRLLDLCRRATTIYQGPFLPEERYAPWAEVKRAALASVFARIQLTMARILESRHEPEAAIECYHRIMDHDPLSAEACQGLMRLYAALGRRSRVRDAYLSHSQALAEQIGEEPDPETMQLYRCLCHSK